MTKLVWKIVLMGDAKVGKTSIRRKYLGQITTKEYIYTIGCDFATKTLKLSDNLRVQYQIFDLAGQQKFDKVRANFYLGAKVGILVYDITNQESLKNLPKWVEEALKNNEGGLETFIIVGNKIDLIDQKTVNDEDVLKFIGQLSKRMGHEIPHVFSSALTGENINLIFEKVTENLLHLVGEKSEEIEELAKEVMKGKELITKDLRDESQWEKTLAKTPTQMKEIFSRAEKPIEKRVEVLENEIVQLTKEIAQLTNEIRNLEVDLAATKNQLHKYFNQEKEAFR
ncbi:MAG: GTP-binding protein [Candidatus Heimdallarchaeota archaeon]|nr:GTP-binding protein [Candidatus Heimdallarchaeota archaeon]